MRNAFLILVPLMLLANPAAGQNFGFLRGGPMERMNKEDMQLLSKNAREALNTLPDGSTNAWTNPKTNHSGTATPQKTFDQKGQKCRLLELTNSADGLRGRGEFTLCKQADGKWKIVS